MKRLFSSLAVQTLAGQALGLAVVATAGLVLLYLSSAATVRDERNSTGSAALEMLTSLVQQDPETLTSQSTTSDHSRLQAAVQDFVTDFNEISRVSIVDYRLRVVADSDRTKRGSVTDQNALIGVMQAQTEHGEVLDFSRGGQRFIRLSHVIRGPYDPARKTDVVGAVSLDIPLAQSQAQLRSTFATASGVVVLAGIVLLGFQFYWFRRSVLVPVHGLTGAARVIAAGDLGGRTPGSSSNELGEVGRAFNAMAEEIERTSTALRESSATLGAVFESSPLAMIETDKSGTVRLWNRAAERTFGWTAEEAVGGPIPAIPAELREESRTIFESLSQGRPTSNYATEGQRRDGSRVDLSLSGAPVRDAAGRITGLVFAIADVSNLKHAEFAMRESNIALSQSVARLEQHTRELVLLRDMGDLLQACTTPEEAHRVVARSVEGIFPGTPGTLFEIPPSRDKMDPKVSWGMPASEVRTFPLDGCWALRRGRTHRVEDPTTSLVCDHVAADQPAHAYPYICVPMMALGEGLGALYLRGTAGSLFIPPESQQLAETVADQTALALSTLRLREALRQQSIRDALTGLFNRRYLDETLVREVDRARRAGIPLSVIMLDLDHFKRFNDEYGHRAGDFALKALGECLGVQVRGDDIASRYGGEEFTLTLPGATFAVAKDRAEQVRRAVRALRLSFDGQSLGTLTVSIGIAVFPEHGSTGPSILQAADAALYRAKANGRDRVEVAE